MSKDLLQYIEAKFKNNFDVKYRTVQMKRGKLHLVFIDDLCDSKFISEYIIMPLVLAEAEVVNVEDIKTGILYSNNIGNIKSKEEAISHILSGDVVIIFEFLKDVIYCEAKGFVKRSVAIPQTENNVKGPKEGFTESFVDNVALIRRKIKNENLKFETITMGAKSNTVVVVAYLNDVAPEGLVNHIKSVLNAQSYEFIIESSYIEELFKNNKSAFDSVGYSEKPDITVSKLFEGRVGIIVDGTPFVLTLPFFFLENFQSGDDYYSNIKFGNITRVLRWIAYFIGTFLVGVYLAVTTYHFSLIPSVFVVRLAVSRAGVPFPTTVEIILMVTFFQIIREAGLRLPQPIGQAMSIVGALILGDAAVGAGLTSQTTVFIVALSSISLFLIPKLSGPTFIWSVIILLFGAFLGLPGFYIGLFMLISHLASLESCGYPYLYPLGTLSKFKYKDVIYRNKLSDISNNLFD